MNYSTFSGDRGNQPPRPPCPPSAATSDGEQAPSVPKARHSHYPAAAPDIPGVSSTLQQFSPSFPSHYIIYHYLSPRCHSTMDYIFRLYRAKTDSAGVRHMPSRNISAVLPTSVTPRTVPAIRALHSSPASALSCSLPPPTSHHSSSHTPHTNKTAGSRQKPPTAQPVGEL